jgi:transketolase
MTAITNGLVLHDLSAFASTFLCFSDYMAPALRLAALMKINPFFVFTHDSIGLGEDGPTHQPVEHLAKLRSVPNFCVMRPADLKETIGAYLLALQHTSYPSAVVLTRQNVPQLEGTSFELCRRGAYIVSQESEKCNVDLIICASGSELQLAIKAKKLLKGENFNVRVVSFFSPFLFDQQQTSYQKTILLDHKVPKVMIEAGSKNYWYKYFSCEKDLVLGIDEFGRSAPEKDVFSYFGFSETKVMTKIEEFLARKAF